ncbi:hypothetical protein [Nocardia altamirensis]|uniref:hypothetical protein n=1 Tax=Nocardia altamirensis TaxID=472158 RepID=UPI00083FDF96|nr:hypothetical protein [Nocardia altamirensis]
MPRSLEEILAHADELADRFENNFEPTNVVETDALEGLGKSVIELSNAQRNVRLWVELAKQQGKSWAAIGEVLGTSGEAARQRYGDGTSSTAKRARGARPKVTPTTQQAKKKPTNVSVTISGRATRRTATSGVIGAPVRSKQLAPVAKKAAKNAVAKKAAKKMAKKH